MKKHEFLRELEISLKDKLSQVDINEILSDYNDIFEDGILENRSEDEISESIGSPAAISKAIMDDSTNINVEINYPPITSDTSNLAPMSKRFLAYFIDTFLVIIILISLTARVSYSTTGSSSVERVSTSVSHNSGDGDMDSSHRIHYKQRTYLDKNSNVKKVKFYKDEKKIFSGTMMDFDNFMHDNNIDKDSIQTTETIAPSSSGMMRTTIVLLFPMLLFFMAFGFANVITAFQLWLFKGYTLGKWLTKIRVVRLDKNKVTFWDAFLRDIILKFIGSAATSGILNMVSFIWACSSTEHKTIHDLAANTKVINIER